MEMQREPGRVTSLFKFGTGKWTPISATALEQSTCRRLLDELVPHQSPPVDGYNITNAARSEAVAEGSDDDGREAAEQDVACVDTGDSLILNELDQQAQALFPGPGDTEDPDARIAYFLRENNDAWAESLTDISDIWDQEEDFIHHCTICRKQYFAAYFGSEPKCASCRIGYQHWSYSTKALLARLSPSMAI
jgi:hypothetical protein